MKTYYATFFKTIICKVPSPTSASPIFTISALLLIAHMSITYRGPVDILMFRYEKFLLLLNSNSFTIFFFVPASDYKNYMDF